MARFEIHYNHYSDYDNQVDVDIRLQSRPSQEEYQDILDAIATLNKVAKKYIPITIKEAKEKK